MKQSRALGQHPTLAAIAIRDALAEVERRDTVPAFPAQYIDAAQLLTFGKYLADKRQSTEGKKE